MFKYLILLNFLFCVVSVAGATSDSAHEARVQKLSAELRCLVCQNQSLADSHADLALDLKNQVREQVKRGASDAQVIAFMTERYGDFVLYRPPVKATTLLLWFGPALLLFVGLGALFMRLRRVNSASTGEVLSAEDHARAAALLDVGASVSTTRQRR
jgi:cytochrome c-type biogenesis protein CcmH